MQKARTCTQGIFLTKSPSETKKLGMIFAKEVLKEKKRKRALLVALEGNLGSGKTTFTQGIAKGLGITRRVQSPTFLIMKRYPLKKKNVKNFYHIDCYRVKGKDLKALGIFDIIKDPSAVIVIEWSKRAGSTIGKGNITFSFSVKAPTLRIITVSL